MGRLPGAIEDRFIFLAEGFEECHAATIVESAHGLVSEGDVPLPRAALPDMSHAYRTMGIAPEPHRQNRIGSCSGRWLMSRHLLEQDEPQRYRLMVAAFFAGTQERNEDVSIWVSRRPWGTQRWSRPVEVATGDPPSEAVAEATLPVSIMPETAMNATARAHPRGDDSWRVRHPTWNPVLFQPPGRDQPLLLFYKVGPDVRHWWGLCRRSWDGGETWSAPTRLPVGLEGPVRGKPVVLPSGRVVAPSSVERTGMVWTSHVETSDDQGHSWHRSPPVNDPSQVAAIQPVLMLQPQHDPQGQHGPQDASASGALPTILMLARTSVDYGYLAWAASRDGGASWSPMARTGLPNPNAGVDAVTLRTPVAMRLRADATSATLEPGDRSSWHHPRTMLVRQLLVYNHSRPRLRTPLNVAASADGVHWHALAVLEASRGGFSYPSMVQVSHGGTPSQQGGGDAIIHILYSWHRLRIRHVALNLSSMELGPRIVDEAWPPSIAFR
eukprot:jgi/Mesvir1/22098/Mv22605-RA.1